MRSNDARALAKQYDSADPLRGFRDRFVIEDPDLIYLDGNSLGRLPKQSAKLLTDVVQEQWGKGLVRSWSDHWIDKPRLIGEKIGALIGAEPGEVLVCDSTSVNFYKLALAALHCRRDRPHIVTDTSNFPSDLYVLQGCAKQTGHTVKILNGEEVEEALDNRTALLALTHTEFKSGFIQPMSRLTARAHEIGALTLWDLSHSVGVMPIDLRAAHVDLAVGCTYKYLNGGPGAPAFLYARKELQKELQNPIWGWFGQKNPFEFALDYSPADGLQRFASGTPSVLSLMPVEIGVDLVLEAGINPIREKSVKQTQFLVQLWEAFLAEHDVTLNSPRNAEQRGSHVSLGHPEAYRVDQALINDMKVVPDFREPDNIRLGVSPLYTTYGELAEATLRLKTILAERTYERYSSRRGGVT